MLRLTVGRKIQESLSCARLSTAQFLCSKLPERHRRPFQQAIEYAHVLIRMRPYSVTDVHRAIDSIRVLPEYMQYEVGW